MQLSLTNPFNWGELNHSGHMDQGIDISLDLAPETGLARAARDMNGLDLAREVTASNRCDNSSARDRDLATSMRRSPRSRSRVATAAPIPEPAPVTR